MPDTHLFMWHYLPFEIGAGPGIGTGSEELYKLHNHLIVELFTSRVSRQAHPQ